MSNASDSDSEDAECFLSVQELKNWKVTDLREWLRAKNLKISGTKETLVNRVYRALTSGQESGEDDGIDAVTCNIQDFELLKDDWKKIDTLDIPPLQVKDVDNYFHYQKNPTLNRDYNKF